MKWIFIILLFFSTLITAQSTSQFIKGVDISFVPQIEDSGGAFYLRGVQTDPVEIFKQNGVGYIRLRLWHTPADGYCGLASSLKMAGRIKGKGLKLLLNFHYSDWWADPENQTKPAAWAALSFPSLTDSIYSYTYNVIKAFKRNNVLPDMVQLGNEISGGFLWNEGKVSGSFDTPQQWQQFTTLLTSAANAVRDAVPDSPIPIMIHIEHGADNVESRRFFDKLIFYHVPFDVIGQSFYPWWQGTLQDMALNLNDLALRYNKDIIVVETAYPWTLQPYDMEQNVVYLSSQLHAGYPATVEGQYNFLIDVIKIVKNIPGNRGKGVFYWAPEYISIPKISSPWENLTLFNFNGNALSSISAFNDSSAAIPCPTGMVSYWNLDETSKSTYIDKLGINNASGITPPAPVTGKVNGAQQFNGNTTKIDVPANPTLDIGKRDNFSIEFWYKGSTVPSTVKSAVGRYISSTGAKWWIGLNANDGKARFYMSGGGKSAAINGTVIVNGSWHHVAATRNGTTGLMKLYVDGVLRGSTSQNFTMDFSSATANLNIGWLNFQSAYALNGILDELAFYNTELTLQDIQQHYNNSLAGFDYCGNNLSQVAPAITSTAVTAVQLGKQYSYDAEATGTPVPAFSLITLPPGMTINSQSGLIQWVPSSPGKYNVTIEAHNGINPPAQQSFIISVTGSQASCPPGIISYWKLDESTQGIYADFIGTNNASSSSPPTPVTGIVGDAQLFNGSTTKIDVPANPSFNFAKNSSFSVEFWYKGSTVPSTVKSAVGRYISSTGAKWWIGLNANDGKARFYMSAGGRSAAINGTVIVNGNWHHVAATRNGTSGVMKLYVDGVLRGSTSQTFTVDFSSSTANLNIGWLNFQSAYALNGSLDEAAIYNTELSSSTILQHYNNDLAGIDYCSQTLLKQIAKSEAKIVPVEYELFQNYPNPFNPLTKIRFSLPQSNLVNIKIYNQLGEEVRELVNINYEAGTYEIEFNAVNLASGIYFYKMQAGEFISVKKLLILK